MNDFNEKQTRGNNDEVARGNNDHLHHASDLKEVNDLNYTSHFKNKKSGLFSNKSDEDLLKSYKTSQTTALLTTTLTTAAGTAALVVAGTVAVVATNTPTVEIKADDIDSTVLRLDYEINISNVDDFSDNSYTYDIKYNTDATPDSYVAILPTTIIKAANTKDSVSVASLPSCHIYISVFHNDEELKKYQKDFVAPAPTPAPTPVYTLNLSQNAGQRIMSYSITIENVTSFDGYTFSIVETPAGASSEIFIKDRRVVAAKTTGTVNLANYNNGFDLELSLSKDGSVIKTTTATYVPPYVPPTYSFDHYQVNTSLMYTITINNVTDFTGYTYVLKTADSNPVANPMTFDTGNIDNSPYYGTFDFANFGTNFDLVLEVYLDTTLVASESITYAREYYNADITVTNYKVTYSWDIGNVSDISSFTKKVYFQEPGSTSERLYIDEALGNKTGNNTFNIPLNERGTTGNFYIEIYEGTTLRTSKFVNYNGIWFDSNIYQVIGNEDTVTFVIDPYGIDDFSDYRVNLYGQSNTNGRVDFANYSDLPLTTGFSVDVDVSQYKDDINYVYLEILDAEDLVNYTDNVSFTPAPETSISGSQKKEAVSWTVSIDYDEVTLYTYTVFYNDRGTWTAVNNDYKDVAMMSQLTDVTYCALRNGDMSYKLVLYKNDVEVDSKQIDYVDPAFNYSASIEQIEGTLSVKVTGTLTNIYYSSHFSVQVYSDPLPGEMDETVYAILYFDSNNLEQIIDLETEITSNRKLKYRIYHDNDVLVDNDSIYFYPDRVVISDLMPSFTAANAVTFDAQLLYMSESFSSYTCQVLKSDKSIHGEKPFTSASYTFTLSELIDGDEYTIQVVDTVTGKVISGSYTFTYDSSQR